MYSDERDVIEERLTLVDNEERHVSLDSVKEKFDLE